MTVRTINEVFRDFVTDGVPSSGGHKPIKGDIRDTLNAELSKASPVVATRTALKALDTTKNTVAYLAEAGREGVLVWRTGDYSAQIAADTLEGVYVKADAVAATVGAWVRAFDGPLYVEWFGAVGDGTTDNAAPIGKAFILADYLGVAAAAGDGEFLTNTTIAWTVAADFEFIAAPGTIIKASGSFPVDSKLMFPSATGARSTFRWRGGKLDGSLMPSRVSGAPDLLYVADGDFKFVEIEGAWFYCNDTRSGTAGDSCLFLAEGEDYRIENNVFQGAVDAGIYISGNAAQTSGRRAVVRSNTFLECATAVISKRSFEDHAVIGNFVQNCSSGIIVGGEADVSLMPGKKAVIANNLVKRTGVAIEVRIADEAIVIGNRVEDFGVDASGTPIGVSGIVISGSKRSVVASNILCVPGISPHASSRGIHLQSRTWNSTTYHSTHNLIEGNLVSGLNQGIREEDANNKNNSFSSNKFVSVTTPYSGITAPSQIDGALSNFKTWDPASVANGASAFTLLTVPGAVLGDYAEVAFSLTVANMSISAFVSAADTVTVVLTNNTGSAVDLGSGTLRARVRPQNG